MAFAEALPRGLHRTFGQIREEPAKYGVLIGAAIILGLGILWPLSVLFHESFLHPETKAYSLTNYLLILKQEGLLRAFRNSMVLSFSVVALSLLIGLPMAWLASRTNMPFSGPIRGVTSLMFVVPNFISAVAWTALLSPNVGYINVFLRDTLGVIDEPFNVFSMGGLILVLTIHGVPLVFYSVVTSLDNIDPSYEEAASVLGAPMWKTILLSFSLVGPALFTGAMLAFLEALSSFGAPAVIGMAGRFHVLTTMVYQLFSEDAQLELAAAVAAPIVIFTLIALYAQRVYLGKKAFTTLTGKSTHKSAIDLGPWRWAAFGGCALIIFLGELLPIGALFVNSIKTIWGARLTWGSLTFDRYILFLDPRAEDFWPWILRSILLGIPFAAAFLGWKLRQNARSDEPAASVDVLIRHGKAAFWIGTITAAAIFLSNFETPNDVFASILMSFKVSAVAATLCVIFAVVLAWLTERLEVRGGGAIALMSSITFAFPALILGIGLYMVSLSFPITFSAPVMFVVAYVVKRYPIAYLFTRNSIKQLSVELEEASRTVGAGWGRSLFDVTVPLLKNTIWVSWILIFSVSLRELPMSIFLYEPGSETMAIQVFLFLEDGNFDNSATLSCIILMLSLAVTFAVRGLGRRAGVEAKA